VVGWLGHSDGMSYTNNGDMAVFSDLFRESSGDIGLTSACHADAASGLVDDEK
jgi:hypothetical protein